MVSLAVVWESAMIHDIVVIPDREDTVMAGSCSNCGVSLQDLDRLAVKGTEWTLASDIVHCVRVISPP